jgi:cell division protein FtsQ
MSRTRERRRRNRQYTGVLRSDRPRTSQESRATEQVEGREGFSWRLISGLMVILLSIVLFLFFYSDVFYVNSIWVGGVEYMTVEEVFTYAEIANYHIFWVEPEQVRENVMRYPSVAKAEVGIGWPPNMITIDIEEREPVLVWEQNGVAFWIDIQGNVMDLREDQPDLVRIVVDDPLIDAFGQNGRLNTDVIYAVIQLFDLRPDVTSWRYDLVKGLGFRNANGWDVWFGLGTNMSEKIQIYETLSSNIIARGIQVSELNIVNPDAPFYIVLWGR